MALEPDIGVSLSQAAAWHRSGRIAEASRLYEILLLGSPDDPDVLYMSGLARLELGDLTVGSERMRKLITLQPGNAAAFQALGKAQYELGQLNDAAENLAHALQIEPDRVDAAIDLARVSFDLRRVDKAEQILRHAADVAPGDARPLVNLGNVLRELGREDEAVEVWETALRLNPACAEARSNMAINLAHQNDFAAAVDLLKGGLAQDAVSPDLLCLLGSLQFHRGQHDDAAESLDSALTLRRKFPRASLLRVQAAMYMCDWAALDQAMPLIAAEIKRAQNGQKCTLSPFFSLQLSTTEEERLAIARAASIERASSLIQHREEIGANHPPHRKDRLHIGYLSADWREHPNGQVMCSAFGHHNRDEFEITVFADCADDGSNTRQEIDRNADRLVDIAHLNELHAAKKIRDLGVDILVDVQGFTGTGRPNISAIRPAPVQVLYQAFCSTTGSDWFDYLIVDNTVLPDSSRHHYSESLVYMPDCYMVGNNTTPIATTPTTREEVGLPTDGVVLCSFSNPYKITRAIFARWMNILDQVPDSVLWLIGGTETMMQNLHNAAEDHGIDRPRIIFAPRCAKAQHLERHRHADLFLDTPIYGAHVSALDSLWVGTPLLTCRGDTFVARVGASFLINLGLNELITENFDTYESLAIELCNSPESLNRVRQKLADALRTMPLFDTARWVLNIEKAYRGIWEAAVAGEHPPTIAVK